jgi:hypothetical protein
MADGKYSDFHNELHEKFSKNRYCKTTTPIIENEEVKKVIVYLTYEPSKKIFMGENKKTGNLNIELYWADKFQTDDGIHFTDPHSGHSTYVLYN